jgi:hypothetical protein
MEAPQYPPAPWRLCGESVQAIHLVPVSAARALVPESARIVSVLPGKTIGVLYCARYGTGSTLSYHELIVAPALTYARGRAGWWISHIHVDDLAAKEGGRAIWGLPKELANFQWTPGHGHVQVSSGAERLCAIEWQPARLALKIPAFLPALSSRGTQMLSFHASGTASLRRCRAAINLPTGSGFEALGFERAQHLWLSQNLRLAVSAPQAIGRA